MVFGVCKVGHIQALFIRYLKPKTLNPKPKTLNPKPKTQNPKPLTPAPEVSPLRRDMRRSSQNPRRNRALRGLGVEGLGI